MPVISANQDVSRDYIRPQVYTPPEQVTTFQTIGAAFQLYNPVTRLDSIAKSLELSFAFPEGDYNPMDDVPDFIKQSDIPLDAYANSRSADETHFITEQIMKDIESQRILEESSGLAAFGFSFLASVLDPVQMLVPGGTVFKGMRSLGTVGRATRMAGITAGSTLASEVALQLGVPTRTYEEAIYETAFATVFAGAAGAVIPARYYNDISDIHKPDPPPPPHPNAAKTMANFDDLNSTSWDMKNIDIKFTDSIDDMNSLAELESFVNKDSFLFVPEGRSFDEILTEQTAKAGVDEIQAIDEMRRQSKKLDNALDKIVSFEKKKRIQLPDEELAQGVSVDKVLRRIRDREVFAVKGGTIGGTPKRISPLGWITKAIGNGMTLAGEPIEARIGSIILPPAAQKSSTDLLPNRPDMFDPNLSFPVKARFQEKVNQAELILPEQDIKLLDQDEAQILWRLLPHYIHNPAEMPAFSNPKLNELLGLENIDKAKRVLKDLGKFQDLYNSLTNRAIFAGMNGQHAIQRSLIEQSKFIGRHIQAREEEIQTIFRDKKGLIEKSGLLYTVPIQKSGFEIDVPEEIVIGNYFVESTDGLQRPVRGEIPDENIPQKLEDAGLRDELPEDDLEDLAGTVEQFSPVFNKSTGDAETRAETDQVLNYYISKISQPNFTKGKHTKEELDAISLYGIFGEGLNRKLRGSLKMSERDIKLDEALQSVIKKSEPLPDDLIVWRG